MNVIVNLWSYYSHKLTVNQSVYSQLYFEAKNSVYYKYMQFFSKYKFELTATPVYTE
jgi:hypothetical protein